MSVEVLSTAVQLYKKSQLKRLVINVQQTAYPTAAARLTKNL